MANWITHPPCGKRWTGLKAEHCTVCHETFSGTRTGDAHRVGEHGVKEGPNRRRCLPPSEVRIRRGRDGSFGLKWNESRQVWQEDRPRPPFSHVPESQKSGQNGVPGQSVQGAVFEASTARRADA